ncbi:MAG TPA: MerR family transcriptional regulator [Actinomycetota bacterium]|nr:MerR family transcriptional regulator [Actinomycetota bacterium]
MEYRVDQLAAACDVSVDTVRFYQSKGLLPAPARRGRVAVYGPDHLKRLRKIRSLQSRGLTLSVIRRVIDGKLARGDADLAAAVAAAQSEGDEAFLTLEDVAERSGVPTALLRAVQRAGLNIGRRIDGEERYTEVDVEMVRVGLRILEGGFPINDLLALASEFTTAAREIANRAVGMFDEHVREPVKRSGLAEDEAAEKLVSAFRELLPAVTSLVAHQFRRVLLSVAEEHIERVGGEAEIAATRAESRRLREVPWPG